MYFGLNEKLQLAILNRVDQWIKFLEDAGNIADIELIKKLKMGMTLDFSEEVPF